MLPSKLEPEVCAVDPLSAFLLTHVLFNRILQQTFTFISPVKTALIGAHYGGFLSIYTLANDPTLAFSCAIAVSPVTSWHTVCK